MKLELRPQVFLCWNSVVYIQFYITPSLIIIILISERFECEPSVCIYSRKQTFSFIYILHQKVSIEMFENISINRMHHFKEIINVYLQNLNQMVDVYIFRLNILTLKIKLLHLIQCILTISRVCIQIDSVSSTFKLYIK